MWANARKRVKVPGKMPGNRGFTVLEVLITTFLVGVSIFALMEAFNRGVFSSGDVENYSLALSLTQRKVEEVKGTAFASVASSAKSPILDITGSNLLVTFEQQVVVSNVHADLKQVDVTTYWNVPGGETSVSLSTYVVNV